MCTNYRWLTEWLRGQSNLGKANVCPNIRWFSSECMGMRRGGVVIWERVGERWLYSLWSCAVCLVCRAYRAERSMTNTAQQVRAINYTQAWMREGWRDIEREEQRARYAQCHPQGKLTLDLSNGRSARWGNRVYRKLNEVVSYHSCGRSRNGHPMPTDIDPYNHKVKKDTPAGCANRDTWVWGW